MIKRFRPPPQSRSTALSLFGKEARCLNRQSRKKTLRRPGSPHSKQRILLPADDQVVSIPRLSPEVPPSPFLGKKKEARCLIPRQTRQKNHSAGQVHPIASSGYLCRPIINRFRFPPQSEVPGFPFLESNPPRRQSKGPNGHDAEKQQRQRSDPDHRHHRFRRTT